MKKRILLTLAILLFLFIFGCSKEETYKVTIHFNDEVSTREVKKDSIINFESLDSCFFVAGWYDDEELTNEVTNQIITSDITIYAKTVMIGEQYLITYNLNGGEFTSSRANKYYAGEGTKLVDPVKNPYYKFTGWEYNGEIITEITNKMYGDITLNATWEDIANYYNIEYVIGNGTVTEELVTVIRQGEEFTLPEAYPTVDECFYGWYTDPEFKNEIKAINESNYDNYTIYAKYGERDAAHTYISFLGDSITTFTGYIPSGYPSYYPRHDVLTVDDTWWMIATNKLGYNLLMNNAFSGSKVGGTDSSACTNIKRIESLTKDGKVPNIVVVYMGTNDWAAATTDTLSKDAANFKTAYETMINNIYTVCGEDVEIFLCILPTNVYSSGFHKLRGAFNDKIIELGNEYNLPLIDLRNAITDENVKECTPENGDVHPNALGMKMIGEYVYNFIYDYENK